MRQGCVGGRSGRAAHGMGVAESIGGMVAPVLTVLPAQMQERIYISLEKGYADYDARVASGTQPDTPGAYPDFLIIANAIYIATTVILYVAMKQRTSGFEIKAIITVYNLSCVVAAGYCAVHIVLYKYHHPGKFVCNELVEGKDGEWLAWVFWVFYAQKFWEFLDTWFFILRRSFRQVCTSMEAPRLKTRVSRIAPRDLTRAHRYRSHFYTCFTTARLLWSLGASYVSTIVGTCSCLFC